jgi:exosortase
MSMRAVFHTWMRLLPAAVCALAGFAVFQFWGNATQGYIATRSVFWWWGSQWFNPASETQHGIMILGIAAWLLWRNLGENSKLQIPNPKSQVPSSRYQVPSTKLEAPNPKCQVTSAKEQVTSAEEQVTSAEEQVTSAEEAEKKPKRREDGTGENSSVWMAGMAMLGGLALHLLGYAVQQTRLSVIALLVFTWGVLVLGGGRRWGRAAAFPLAFMIFAIPVDVLDTIGFYLRLGVVDVAAAIAHALGLGVVRNGTLLFSPHGGYQYDVAAACSGVRSLMALAALSLLVGYLSLRAWWARLVVLVLCGPYTFAGNVVRTTAIVVAAEWFGQRAGNLVHEWFGFVVFAIVLALQLATVRVLQYRRADTGGRDAETGKAIPDTGERKPVLGTWNLVLGTSGSARRSWTLELGTRNFLSWATAAVVVLAASLVGVVAGRLDTLQARPEAGVATAANGRDPADLPSFLAGGWLGEEVPVSAAEREILPPDTGFARKNYVWLHDRARQVFVSIVLSGRDRTSIHRPELCLVGQGWTIQGKFDHDFGYPGSGRGQVPATVLRVRREVMTSQGGRVAVPSLVAYWFVGRDRVVAGHWERMWWSAVDRLEHWQGSRWAYVLVQTNASDGEAEALARLQTVLDQTLPAFQRPPG